MSAVYKLCQLNLDMLKAKLRHAYNWRFCVDSVHIQHHAMLNTPAESETEHHFRMYAPASFLNPCDGDASKTNPAQMHTSTTCKDRNTPTITQSTIISNRFALLSHVETNTNVTVSSPPSSTPVNVEATEAQGMTSGSGYNRRRRPGVRLGSWNVRGLTCHKQTFRKLREVIDILVSKQIDVLAVQESWESGKCVIPTIGRYKWIGKPRQDNESGEKRGGVGFLIRDTFMDSVQVIMDNAWSDSIWLKVCGSRGKEDMYIGCVYMPVEGSNQAESAFVRLTEDVQRFQEAGQVILLGDFNARVGRAEFDGDIIGTYGEEITPNKNGTMLIQLLRNNNLATLNDRKQPQTQFTRKCPAKNEQSVIDYCIMDISAAILTPLTVCDIDIAGTDHMLLHCDVYQIGAPRRNREAIRRWRLEKLEDPEIRKLYEQGIANEVDGYAQYVEGFLQQPCISKEDITNIVKRAENIITEVANTVIGTKLIIPGRAAKWWSDDIKSKIRERRQLWQEVKQTPNDAVKKAEYMERRKAVNKVVNAAQAAHTKAMFDDMNKNYHQHKNKFWKTMRTTYRRSSEGILALRNEDQAIVTSTQGKLEVATKHYTKLFQGRQDADFDEDFRAHVENEVALYESQSYNDEGKPELNVAPDLGEVALAIKQSPNGKAGSPLDNMVNELLKCGGIGISKLIQVMLSATWQAEITPDHWHSGVITSIYKKGDKRDMDNYRGITLLSVIGKLHNRIINNRLVKAFDVTNTIHEGQNGFRRRRNCIDHILTLSQILLGRKRQGKRTYAFFLDIQKAYDTVWRNGLWYKLWQLGVRGKAWRIIKEMYKTTKSCVSIDGKLGEFFDMTNGVAQGDTLSPTLFSMFINSLLEEVEQQHLGFALNDIWMGALMFADDYVGICESGEELQSMIDALYMYSRKYRFNANVSKCAVVVFGDVEPVQETWSWGEQAVPVKDSYTYLGVQFERSCGWDLHASAMVEKGVAKSKQLQPLLANKHLSTEVKRTLLMSILKPTLAYAGEVWEPSARLSSQLETVLVDACRVVLQCGDRTSHEVILGDLDINPLRYDRIIQKLKFRYHVDHLPEHRFPSRVAKSVWPSNRRGRQTQMWTQVTNNLAAKYLPDVDISGNMSEAEYVQRMTDSVHAHLHLDWELEGEVTNILASQ